MIRYYSRREFEQRIIERFKLELYSLGDGIPGAQTAELWRCPNGRTVVLMKPEGGHVSYTQAELDGAFDMVKATCAQGPIAR